MREKRGERPIGQESYSRMKLLGKLQENLTEVLWRQLWPLYTTHTVCT